MKWLIGMLLLLALQSAQAQTSGQMPVLGGPVAVRGIPFNSNRLAGLSQSWANSQYQLYTNSVLALNRVLRRSPRQPADSALTMQLFNRQALYYGFLENLGGSGPPGEGPILALMREGGLDWPEFQTRVLDMAAYLEGGNGWIIWEYNLLDHSNGLYLAQDETDVKLGSVPLLVLNLNTTASEPVSGQDVADYTRRLLANLRWDAVLERLAAYRIR